MIDIRDALIPFLTAQVVHVLRRVLVIPIRES